MEGTSCFRRILFARGRAAAALSLVGAALIALAAGAANATTLTFDSDPLFLPPNGDGGLTFNNLWVVNDTCCRASGYANGNVSPPNELYNPDGAPGSFTSAIPFTLTSFYLTAAWNDGLNVLVQGKNGATILDSITLVVSTGGPTLESFNWGNLTEVDLTSFGGVNHGYNGSGEHFVIDNLTINGTVPEPVTLSLVGGGLVGAAGMRRRRK